MKRLAFFVTAAIGALMACSAAYAADLGVRPIPQPAAAPVPYYNWAGGSQDCVTAEFAGNF